MPEVTCKEITEARNRLDANVRLVVWSVLFLIWCVWAWWWVVPAAVIVMAWGYGRALAVAGTYAELLKAAFDVYRLELYKSLRWPLPANPEEEHRLGRQLTAYLQRGSDSSTPSFS